LLIDIYPISTPAPTVCKNTDLLAHIDTKAWQPPKRFKYTETFSFSETLGAASLKEDSSPVVPNLMD
jgi:hypothetical protein